MEGYSDTDNHLLSRFLSLGFQSNKVKGTLSPDLTFSSSRADGEARRYRESGRFMGTSVKEEKHENKK